MLRILSYPGHGPQRRDWLAGLRGLELRNDGPKYRFEMSRGFSAIQPKLGREGLSEVSDNMRELVEEEWPELVHKLPPKILVRFDLSLDADKDRADNCSLFPKLLLTQCRLI
jgi:hypothetical protein